MDTIVTLETKILFRHLLKKLKPELVCDIGSCDGSESIRFSTLLPQSSVLAFEANPQNYEAIKANPKIGERGIDLRHLAVQNKNEQVFFNVIDTNTQKNKGTSSLYSKPNMDEVQVEVTGVRLDSFVTEHYANCDSIALWIDVEGAGYQVLEGLSAIKDKVAFFQIEVEEKVIWEGQKLKDELITLAQNLGFSLIARGHGDFQYDLLFVNNQIDPTLIRKVINKSALVCKARSCLFAIREFKRKWIYKSKKAS